MEDCPICEMPNAEVRGHGARDASIVVCRRCGEFEITRSAAASVRGLAAELHRGRFAVSHELARLRAGGRPSINSTKLEELWRGRLPNPQQLADNLLLFVGGCDLPYGRDVAVNAHRLAAIIGTEDSPDSTQLLTLTLVLKEQQERGLILHHWDGHAAIGDLRAQVRMTFDGWARYEELIRNEFPGEAIMPDKAAGRA